MACFDLGLILTSVSGQHLFNHLIGYITPSVLGVKIVHIIDYKNLSFDLVGDKISLPSVNCVGGHEAVLSSRQNC